MRIEIKKIKIKLASNLGAFFMCQKKANHPFNKVIFIDLADVKTD